MSPIMNTQVEADPKSGRRDLPTGMLERITLVLDAFESRSAMLNLEEVVRRTSLPRSTTHRILEQLVKMEWLQRDHPGYGVGRRALGVESGNGNHADLRHVAAPYLHRLCMRTGMVVVLSVLEDGEELVLDKLGGPNAGRMEPMVGHRSAAHLSTGGRVMLSSLPSTTVDHLSQQWDTVGEDAPWSLHTLRKEFNVIRRRHGLCIEEPGARSAASGSVAAVIHGPEHMVAAIRLAEAPGGCTLDQASLFVLDVTHRVSRALCQGNERLLRAAHDF